MERALRGFEPCIRPAASGAGHSRRPGAAVRIRERRRAAVWRQRDPPQRRARTLGATQLLRFAVSTAARFCSRCCLAANRRCSRLLVLPPPPPPPRGPPCRVAGARRKARQRGRPGRGGVAEAAADGCHGGCGAPFASRCLCRCPFAACLPVLWPLLCCPWARAPPAMRTPGGAACQRGACGPGPGQRAKSDTRGGRRAAARARARAVAGARATCTKRRTNA
jgi:hypothetical protein